MDNKYQNAKIYKIVDVGYTKCYIGSTTENLSQRFARHRMHYYSKVNGKRYTNMRSLCLLDEFGVDNCKIELIENYPCENREQLLKREGYHIKKTNCVNRCVAGRTSKEYKEDNKDAIREWTKQYNLQNKHIFNERRREYRQQYYLDHKEERNEKIECVVCGLILRRLWLARHEKTEKHLNALNGVATKGTQCCICNGTYTDGRQERHERTQKHQKALAKSEVASP